MSGHCLDCENALLGDTGWLEAATMAAEVNEGLKEYSFYFGKGFYVIRRKKE